MNQWIVLVITAITDGLIAMGTGLTSAMVTQDSVVMPSGAVWLVSGIAGGLATMRTIQQGLKKLEG